MFSELPLKSLHATNSLHILSVAVFLPREIAWVPHFSRPLREVGFHGIIPLGSRHLVATLV